MGSSFLPGEIIAAFLWAQMEEADGIILQRLERWHRYHNLLEPLENQGSLRRPIVPMDCQHNAHMYDVLLSPGIDRQGVDDMNNDGINAVFHYVPLHSSLAGQKYGRQSGDLTFTDSISERLIRLPLWIGLTLDQQNSVVKSLNSAICKR